jgi:hypothetical protein
MCNPSLKDSNILYQSKQYLKRVGVGDVTVLILYKPKKTNNPLIILNTNTQALHTPSLYLLLSEDLIQGW